MTKTLTRQCVQCGDPVRGRSDKKYCSDDCRTAYHNSNNRNVSNYMLKVNRILRKNRRILAKFNPHGKSYITKEKLLMAGFNLAYCTTIYKTKGGATYFFCYDQGYLEKNEEVFTLVTRKEYVD